MAWRAILLSSLVLLQACATSSELRTARAQFKQGSTDAALETLDTASVSSRDTLLLLLDKALVAQAAGNYETSIIALENAYQLVDDLDYISARDQTSALLSNDWAIRYSGEYSERLWIHTFQMINYLMLNQPDGAAVEARRAVKLYADHADVLDDDLFTRYLMILSFDAAGQRDSAMVEYRKLSDHLNATSLKAPGIAGRELVLFVASGFIEPKLPGDILVDVNARISFPYYPDGYHREPEIDVLQGASILDASRVDTQLLSVARSALSKRGNSIAARHALRLAAKYSLAESIADEDPLAGGIARLLLVAMEQADTRSWETLPANLALVRVALPDDTDSVEVRINSTAGPTPNLHSRKVKLDLNDAARQFRLIRVGVAGSTHTLPSP